MRATSGIFKGLNPTITVVSKVFIIAFVSFCALQAEQAGIVFGEISTLLLQNFKWFYILMMTGLWDFYFI